MVVGPPPGYSGTRRQRRQLRRVFVWGSFVTAKPAPRDVDILLIMSEDFEVDRIFAPAQVVFDSTRAKLLYESDVFWAWASIGDEVLDLWLDTYQTSRSFRKRGIVNWSCRYSNRRPNAARATTRWQPSQNPHGGAQVHSREDYTRMAEPILLEIQQREQQILEYLSGDLEQPIAS